MGGIFTAHQVAGIAPSSYPEYAYAMSCQGMASCLTMEAIAVFTNPSEADTARAAEATPKGSSCVARSQSIRTSAVRSDCGSWI